MKDEKKLEKTFDIQLLKRLVSYTKPYIMLLFITVLLLGVVTSVDLIRPYLMKTIVDDYILPTNSYYKEVDSEGTKINDKYYEKVYFTKTDNTLFKENDEYIFETENNTYTLDSTEKSELIDYLKSGILKIALLFLILIIVGFTFNYIQIYILHYVGQKIIYNLREDLFKHIESLSMRFFEKNPVGRLVTRVTNDMQNISEMYTNVIVTFLKDIIIIVGTMVIMFSMNFKLAAISLSTVPLIIFASYLFRKKARVAHREVKVKIAKINSTLSENISGMKIIKIFSREKFVGDKFDDINKEHLDASLKEVKIFAIFRPSMNLVYSLSLSFIIVYGGYAAIGEKIEIGVLIAFTTYVQQFFRPIFDLTEKFNIMQAAMASMERIFILFDDDTKIENDFTENTIKEFKGHIEFKNVYFEYNKDEEVLRDVSFEVKPGETIAFVGATGSGKTTIMNLITRFYDIKSGQILIDGIDIKELDKNLIRQNISSVLQDVFLFSGDIKSNITLSKKDISIERIIDISKYVNADKFISELPLKYDTEVTERGSTFSSGERQLLSFARALVFDPRILILDEATSNIDTETEILIQDAIEKVIKGRTTLVVAHRLSTIRNADKIIVLHKGKIREMGSHNELIKHEGIYHNLYTLQYK